MLAKLTRDSSSTGEVGGQYRPATADNAPVPQQEITLPQNPSDDMVDITSLENLFDNPDMLNWASVISSINKTILTSRQNDIDSYLVDYSGIEMPGAVA